MVSTRLMAGTTGPLLPVSQQQSSMGGRGGHQLVSPDSDSDENNLMMPSRGLSDMPVEILEKIFGYMSYKQVGQLRSVSKKINVICCSMLNSTFQKLQNQILARFQSVKAKMPRR